MPALGHCRDAIPTAFERLRKLQRKLSELALFIALVSTILLHPVHPGRLSLHHSLSPTLYSMSLVTSILSCTASLMLEFYCDGVLEFSQLERTVMWFPLILLDISIIELIAGVSSCFSPAGQGFLGWYAKILVLGCVFFAVWLSYRWTRRAIHVRFRTPND